ncbi:MAG: DNA polymerase III subunit delta [Abditibacteriota bacterium]|nr:DNA polymerase III subunit delta [Abditibacteriota bacterium]
MAKKEIYRVYLLRGRDDYSKDKALEELLKEITDPDFEVFDLDEVTGSSATASLILTGAGILPAGSPRRTVLVKFAHTLPAAEQKELARNLYMVPDTGCVILHVPAPDMKDGKPAAGSSVAAELSKAAAKYGKVLDFEPVTKKKDVEAKVVPFVREQFAAAGKKIEPGAVDLLISRTGTDFTLLSMEIQKLCAYAADKSAVTAEDVKESSSLTPEEKVFDFIDALLKKQASKAVSLTEDLFIEGNDPAATALRLLSLLAGQLRQLWQARIIVEKGPGGFGKTVTQEDMGEYARYFPANSILGKAPWLQNKFLGMAGKVSFSLLADWFRILSDADASLKGIDETYEEPEAVIKQMVFRLMGTGA